MNRPLFLGFFLLLIAASFAHLGGKRTLVVTDSDLVQKTHSLFFNWLKESGYSLVFVSADETVAFRSFGEWNFDHLILFAPSAQELPTGITARAILDFIDDGNNVVLVGGPEMSKQLRDVASDCNVEFDEEDAFAIDHFNFNASNFDGQHTLIVADQSNVASVPIIFEKSVQAPVLFQGSGLDIEEDSALLFSLLSGYSTSYSHSPVDKIDDLHVAGKRTSLVTALQARNNARVLFSGSLDLFSDQFFNSPVQKYTAEGTSTRYEKSGNELFAKQAVQWTFQERGILRASNVQHHRVGEKETPFTYTIKDDIEYSVEIEEWNGKKWVPFLTNDLQLEFRMLDPYVRSTLKHDSKGKYFTSYKLPDVYGVFTFKIEYVRRGYGFLTSISRVPVRPFRHNEYERFIESAYPYYASAFSMMAGLFLFSWFFLYHRERKL